MAISTFAGNLVLDWLLSTATATRPTAWYLALHVGDPGLTGANELVVGTDADYVRKAITFAAASGLTKATNAGVTWTADVAATTYVVTHIGIWDALTAGNFLMAGALAVPETVVASGSLNLGSGRAIGTIA